MIEVRKIQQRDLANLYERLELLGFNKTTISNNLENIMLVFDNNKICGAGCVVNIKHKCLLNWIHISKDFRREHLGTALVKTILNNAELNGAKEAYIAGDCDGFAVSLEFSKVEIIDELMEMKKLYDEKFGESFENNIYKVNLVDYFKPCSSK